MLTIPTSTNRYGDGLETTTISVGGLSGTTFDLCHIGVVPEGREARQVFQGPMVPGPFGYAVTHPLVIDNAGGSANDRDAALRIDAGDPFQVQGLPGVWMFASPRPRHLDGDGPRLVEYVAPDYNGWTNYETWLMNLHITNDQSSYEQVREVCQLAHLAVIGETPHDCWTPEQHRAFATADAIQEWAESAIEDRSMPGEMFADLLASDLLRSALSEVAWSEIARHFIAEADEAAEAGR